MTRWLRHLAPLALVGGLSLLPAAAIAQQPADNKEKGFFDVGGNEEPTNSEGEPLYGYLATALLGAGAIFAVCKSARR